MHVRSSAFQVSRAFRVGLPNWAEQVMVGRWKNYPGLQSHPYGVFAASGSGCQWRAYAVHWTLRLLISALVGTGFDIRVLLHSHIPGQGWLFYFFFGPCWGVFAFADISSLALDPLGIFWLGVQHPGELKLGFSI